MEHLQQRAARERRRIEAELRAILEAAVRPQNPLKLSSMLAAAGRKVGLTEDDIDAAVTKIARSTNKIHNYPFVTTDVIEPHVAEYAATFYEKRMVPRLPFSIASGSCGTSCTCSIASGRVTSTPTRRWS